MSTNQENQDKAAIHAFWDEVHFNEAMASIPAVVGGVGQTAPRVTIEQIEAEIESEHYFTATQGINGAELALRLAEATKPILVDPAFSQKMRPDVALDRTLFCVLVMKNGMRVEGVNHGSVSAANQYPREKCEQLAREAAIEKLWPMFGFELAQKLYRGKQAAALSSLGSK